jgi:hypothetical protein
MRGSPTLTPDAAEQLGLATISPAEVKRALKGTRTGTSPGLDGIPADLYRRFKPIFLPLLSRLYSATGSSGRLPPGFLDGLIALIYKQGDRADPNNYRPITLLGSDYRLLAKVLANRLGPLLPSIISPEQTAFVAGRRIGENVLLLQLLPHLLFLQKPFLLGYPQSCYPLRPDLA